MATLNKQIIIGNIGKISQLKQTSKGVPVINFSVAVNDGSKAQWFDVAVFGPNAINCAEYIFEGMLICVEGKSVFEDFNGISKHKVIAEAVQFLSKKAS